MKLSERLHQDKLDGYSAKVEELESTLEKIAKWFGEFPETGDYWQDSRPVSYRAAYGSDGERDYMRRIAREALIKSSDGLETGD